MSATTGQVAAKCQYGEIPWIDGWSGPSDITPLIESWRYLPSLEYATDAKQAAGWHLKQMVANAAADRGALHLAGKKTPGGNWLCGYRKLAWDSGHFGFPMGQLETLISADTAISPIETACGAEVIGACVKYAQSQGTKHITAAIECGDMLSQLAAQTAGFRMMDALVLHHLDSLDIVASFKKNSAIRPATKEDLPVLEAISAECFGNRHLNLNRFNADATFSEERVRALYEAWIRNSINAGLADEVLVYVADGKPVGFITMQLPTASDKEQGQNTGHIPLNAVDSAHHGKGIYNTMVQAALIWFKEQGCQKVDIKTQLPNNAVHRAWSKLGARLIQSWYRYHWSA